MATCIRASLFTCNHVAPRLRYPAASQPSSRAAAWGGTGRPRKASSSSSGSTAICRAKVMDVSGNPPLSPQPLGQFLDRIERLILRLIPLVSRRLPVPPRLGWRRRHFGAAPLLRAARQRSRPKPIPSSPRNSKAINNKLQSIVGLLMTFRTCTTASRC